MVRSLGAGWDVDGVELWRICGGAGVGCRL